MTDKKLAPSWSKYHTSWPGFGGCPNYLPDDYDENEDKPMDIAKHFNAVNAAMVMIDTEPIREFIEILTDARKEERMIFVIGNGGSASLSSHFAADLSKNTRRKCRCKTKCEYFRVICLSDNLPALTAYANDEGYDTIFQRQLAALADSKCVVIFISGSGNSPNVVKAAEYMRLFPLAKTISLTGFDGGELAGMTGVNIHVDSNCYEVVEDAHSAVLHAVVRAFKGEL